MHLSRTIIRAAALFCLGALAQAQAAGPLTLKVDGVAIDAASMGTFRLKYPSVEVKEGGREQPAEVRLSDGKALMRYPSGISLAISIVGATDVKLEFAGPIDRMHAFRMDGFTVPFNYVDGGIWQIGDGGPKVFPSQKPERPFLYQGNAGRFELCNAEGRRLVFEVPRHAYQQLQDNREWNNNKTFTWWFSAPCNPDWTPYRVKVMMDASDARRVVQVDRFGQSTRKAFPGKVTDAAQLTSDVATDQAYFECFTPNPGDTYGGLPGSGKRLGLGKTGFFHVEKKALDGRDVWLLVDPEGNAFFHLGICAFSYGDDYTYIEGREDSYEWLPERHGEFAAAWHPESYWNPHAVSFYRANVIRKFGTSSEDVHYGRLVDRVRRIGFNSGGAFSGAVDTFGRKGFPMVKSLPLGRWSLGPAVPGVRGVFDPFDKANLTKMDELFAKSVADQADDPLIIGYFLANEQWFEDIPRAIPALDGKHACKRDLAKMLGEKYPDITAFNTAWSANAESFESLADRGLPLTTKMAFDDMQAYTERFLDVYYRTITETFRKYDRNHMLIGNRWQPGTANNELLCRTAGRYMDVISINYYASIIDEAFIRRLYEWTGRKPQFWSEFYYTSEKESNVHGGGHDMATQRERGLAYRNYVEGAAALGFVVGVEWFTLIDQAVTGRFFERYNGERNNTGLFNVCDRPYKPMLAEMATTHAGVYDVWLSGKAPYVIDDPRFGSKPGDALRSISAGHATGPMKIDGLIEGWPGRPPERIGGDRLVLGRETGSLEASFKVCWDEDNLYVLVNVTDATPMMNLKTGNKLWSADCIELFIGSEKLDQGGTLLFTDRQILIGVAKGGSSYVSNAAQQPAIEMVIVPAVDGHGYTLEAAIPWSALSVEPSADLELLFDMAVDNSDDGHGRTCQLMWNGGLRNSADRGAWGRLRLVP